MLGKYFQKIKKVLEQVKWELDEAKFFIPLLLFILLLSSFAIAVNFQNSFALTPVADLTGDWSGFAQVTNFLEASCEFTGKVNAHLTQHENDMGGRFSFVATSAKPTQTEYGCEVWSIEREIHGTIDGSRGFMSPLSSCGCLSVLPTN